MTHERRDYSGTAAATTISAGIGAGDTSISITSSTGWPAGSNGPFFAVIDRGLSTEEKVKVTSRTGTTLTVASRGADGTSAASHSAGAAIEHVWTKTDADEANSHYADTGLDHHTQYLNTTRHDVEARHTFGAAYGTPDAAAAVSLTAGAAGSGNNPAREDHAHLLPVGVPRGELDWDEKTADVSLTSSDTVILTCTATTALTNRKILLVGQVNSFGTIAGGATLAALGIRRNGGSALREVVLSLENGAGGVIAGGQVMYRDVIAAASTVTYEFYARTNTGTANVDSDAAAEYASFYVADVGGT